MPWSARTSGSPRARGPRPATRIPCEPCSFRPRENMVGVNMVLA